MALAGLGGDLLEHAVAHVGLAGVLTRAQADAVAASLPIARVTVSDDRPTSLAGALDDSDGALVAVGTGTFIAARRDDVISAVGGWGLRVSDQASGGWLGRALLEQVLLCHDGLAAHSDLTGRTMSDLGGTPEAIVAYARDAGAVGYAALAPSVVAAAEAGDTHACALMQRGADYLNHALDVLGLAGHEVLCLTGGIGPHYAARLRPEFARRLQPPKGTALEGAMRLARRALAASEPA